MARYENHARAPYGLYVSTRPVDARFVGAEGERLDGIEGATYRRIPTPLAVLLAPVFGGLFVMAFPVVIFAAIFTAIARMVGAGAREAATSTARVATARYATAAAFVDGKGEDRPEGTEEELADLEAEVADRRRDA